MYIRRLNEASLIIFNWLCNINVFSPLVVLLVVHFLNYFPFVKAYEVFFISFVTSYWCTILFPPTGVDHPKRKRAWLCSVSPQRTVLIFHRTGKSTIFLFFFPFLPFYSKVRAMGNRSPVDQVGLVTKNLPHSYFLC